MFLDLSTEGRAVVFSESAESVAGAVKLVRELVHEIEEVRAQRGGGVGAGHRASDLRLVYVRQALGRKAAVIRRVNQDPIIGCDESEGRNC